jgi:hypothetical protein
MSKVDATCAQPVYDLWVGGVQMADFVHTSFGNYCAKWISPTLTHSLCKFFTQVIPGRFGNIPSVNIALYTFYTPLIKPTTNCMKGIL